MASLPEDCYFLSDHVAEDLILYRRGIATYENYQIAVPYVGTKLIVDGNLATKVVQAASEGTEDNFPDRSRRLVCYVPTFALARNETTSQLEPCPIVLRRKKEPFSTWGPIEKSRPSRVELLQKNFGIDLITAHAIVAVGEELIIPITSTTDHEFKIEFSPLGIIYDSHANTRVPKYVPPTAVVVFCQIKNNEPVESAEGLLNSKFSFAHHLLPKVEHPELAIPPRPQESGVLADSLYVMAYNGLAHIYNESLDDWSRLAALALMEKFPEIISSTKTTTFEAEKFEQINKTINS